MNAAAASTRDRLLDAAEVVVTERGTNALTLDAVAAEAGVSKGGLLYHFHAKDDLLQAMIQRMIQAYRSRLDAALANSDPAPGSFTHACINALSDLPPAEQARFQRLSSALLAAVTADPRLLDPLRTLYRELFSRIATDGIPPGNALAAFAICDALWFWSMFNLPQPPPDHVAAAMDVLRNLIRPTPLPTTAPAARSARPAGGPRRKPSRKVSR